MRLPEYCHTCTSWNYCGRPCKNAPKAAVAPVVAREPARRPATVVAPDPVVEAPVAPQADADGWIVEVACEVCGKRVMATKRRRFCSDRCRVASFRRKLLAPSKKGRD